MRDMRNAYGILVEKSERKTPLGLGVYGRIILKWIPNSSDGDQKNSQPHPGLELRSSSP
jgi:hypothetical protein